MVGDFNGDGKPDMAVSAYNGVNVLLGKGDGSFQPAVVYGSNSYAQLTGADFDGDGNLDLVGLQNNAAYIFLGKGDGTLRTPAAVVIAGTDNSYPAFLAVADMNGDGKPDLIAATSAYTSWVAVLLGKGDGSFQPATSYPADGFYDNAMVVGDFNGDGKPDVATLYWSAASILQGKGDGTLQSPVQSSLTGLPGSYAVAADLNGDGKLDLAYVGYSSGPLLIAFGNGNGTLQPGVSLGAGTNYFGNIAVADFNGDGRPDAAVTVSNGNSIQIFFGGQFSGPAIQASHNGNFTAGQTGAVYQIVVANPFFSPTTGTVSVSDTLPPGLTATAITGQGWTCVLNTVTCTRSDALSSGNSFQPIFITVSVSNSLGATTVTNRVSSSSSLGAGNATDVTTIVLPTSISLSPPRIHPRWDSRLTSLSA